MRFLFWGSAAFVAYVYAGYPLLLVLWARLAPKRRAIAVTAAAPCSGISIVIAARNEGARLADRIRNLLTLDSPVAHRQIIVVSDGSTDDTEAVVAAFGGEVDLVSVPPAGKAAALNAGVAHARHDVLVFADARQTFATEALSALVAPLADRTVGGVSGELILGCEPAGRRNGSDRRTIANGSPEPELMALPADRRCVDRRGDMTSTVADAVGIYWRYEKKLRQLESTVGSMLGATGAIYALRRELWRPLPEGTLLDDVLAPMRAVLAGRRVVFEPAAQAFDATTSDADAEARRKIRTLAGNFQILWLEPRLLVPFVNPVWLQYVSHKLGRLLVPYALIGLITASIALAETHPFYAVVLGAQCVAYLLGGYGALLELDRPLLAWPAMLKRRSAASA